MKIALAEAKKLQENIDCLLFVKTLNIVPYLHTDIDGIAPPNFIGKIVKVLKKMGYIYKNKGPHSYVFSNPKKNVEFELHFKIGLDGICYLKYEDLKISKLFHEVYNRILGEDFYFNIPDVYSCLLIELMRILDNKILYAHDMLELILLGLDSRVVRWLLDLPQTLVFPMLLTPKAYLRVLRYILPKIPLEINPLYIGGHIVHYASIRNRYTHPREIL